MLRVNELYYPVFDNETASLIDLLGGRGRGGSHFMAQHAIISLKKPEYYRGFFMRAIHNDIRTSLWKGLMDRLTECFESGELNPNLFKIKDHEMHIQYLLTKNEISSKGFKTSSSGQTANLKSLEGATTIYIEEAEETTDAQHLKLSDSLRTTKGRLQIFRSWNIPTKQHYLVKNWYNTEPIELIDSEGEKYEGWFKLKPKGIKNHLMIFGTYHDNAKNIPTEKIEEWENYYYTNPEHYWSDICGFASGGAKGVIFKFNKHWFLYDKLPKLDFHESYSIDFGGGGESSDKADGSSKTVFGQLLINKDTMSVYVKILLYKGHIDSSELYHYIRETTISINDKGKIQKKTVMADNARKDKIREMLNVGINVIGAKTKEGGSNKIVTGYDIMKKYKIYIHVDDKHAQTELNEHKWEFAKTTGEPTGNPVDKYKDVVDMIRYGVVNYDLYNW